MEASLPTSNPYLPGSMLIYRRVLMLILLFVISIFLTGQQEYAWSSTSNFSARCNTMFPRWSCGRSSERKRRNREENKFPLQDYGRSHYLDTCRISCRYICRYKVSRISASTSGSLLYHFSHHKFLVATHHPFS